MTTLDRTSKVWVAYATQTQQFHIAVAFQEGMTALDAIVQSGIQAQIELPEKYQLGIFGVKIADEHQLLQAGDRVEIYRALTINPKDIRRNRAKANPVGRYCRGNRYRQLLSK
ncbi:RnfH family protein [Acinetobacter piscicola]|uniref:RnfH family protein n=1 Tax=Acinetobacter piscicola TaxID=2006115 RepID=UPI0035563885